MSDQWAGGEEVEVAFSYRRGPFDEVYESTRPRLIVDGRELPVSGWGIHYFQLPVGRHRLRVTVPFRSEEFAAGECDIEVVPGVRVSVEYRAPRVMALRAELREIRPQP